MLPDLLTDPEFLWGVLSAVAGVGFWLVGPVVGYYLWKRWRGPDAEDG